MKEKLIYIGADVEDTNLKNEQEWIAKIVDAAHKNERVIIMMTEGPALEEINYKGKKLISILNDICIENNWPLTKFHFEVMNLVQDDSVWPSISTIGLGDHFLSCQNKTINIIKSFDKTFGMFIGRSSWDRLLIASHLYHNHRSASLQTYRTYLDNPANMLHIDIDRLLWHASALNKLQHGGGKIIESTLSFIRHLPLLIDNGHHGKTHIQWQEGAVGEDILGWYKNIFVDVVCEKMITGQTFFPTEKTARPLISRTPFLAMAAPNHIYNLKKLGFKSFDKWWDESYDYQQGLERIESIMGIIDNLGQLSKTQLQDMYTEMSPILEHNYNLYRNLNSQITLSTF